MSDNVIHLWADQDDTTESLEVTFLDDITLNVLHKASDRFLDVTATAAITPYGAEISLLGFALQPKDAAQLGAWLTHLARCTGGAA